MSKVIAVYSLSNVEGLAMYDVNEEQALIGSNSEQPQWYPIEFLENEDDEDATDLQPYVIYGKLKLPLGLFMRV